MKALIWSSSLILIIIIGIFVYFFYLPSNSELLIKKSERKQPLESVVIHNSFIRSDKIAKARSIKDVSPEEIFEKSSILKEVVLEDFFGKLLFFPKYFSSLITEFNEKELEELFEKDFTAFIYYNGDGAWPGYVAKLKPGTDTEKTRTYFGSIKKSTSLNNLFLEDPEDPSPEGFKHGELRKIATEYLTYSKTGAAINYAWVNNYLILTTNFEALREILANRLISEEQSIQNEFPPGLEGLIP